MLSWIITLLTNLSNLNEKSCNLINPILISETFALFTSNISVDAISCSFPFIVNFFRIALDVLSAVVPDTFYLVNPYSDVL